MCRHPKRHLGDDFSMTTHGGTHYLYYDGKLVYVTKIHSNIAEAIKKFKNFRERGVQVSKAMYLSTNFNNEEVIFIPRVVTRFTIIARNLIGA